MRRRGGLGRGLDALIPSGPQGEDDREAAIQTVDQEPIEPEDTEEPSGPIFEQLRIDHIDPNPRQPRAAFDEEPMQELAASIEAVGTVQGRSVRAPQMTRTTAAGSRMTSGTGTQAAVPTFGETPVSRT